MDKGFSTILIISIVAGLTLIFGGSYYAIEKAQFGAQTLTVRQGGTGQSSFGSSTLLYGNDTGALRGTSSPVVSTIIASSTSATSTFQGGLRILRGVQLVDRASCTGLNVLVTDANGFINCSANTVVLTPWVSDIDADGYDIIDLNTITATSSLTVSGSLIVSGTIFSSTTLLTNATSTTLYISGVSSFNGASTTITSLQARNATSTNLYVTDVASFNGASTTITQLIAPNATSSVFAATTLLGIAGEYFNDLTGTGLIISGNQLQSSLGTSVTLTSEVDGILPIANGGTNNSAFGNPSILAFNGTSVVGTSTPTVQSLTATSTIISSSGLFASGSVAFTGVQTLYSGLTSTASSSLLNVINFSGTNATTTNLYVTDVASFNGASTTIVNLSVGGDNFNDLTGTGLQISGNALQSTLGTSITLTSEVDGILPVANGGTNNSVFAGNTLIGFDGTRLIATSTPSFQNFYATSTTATSTITGNFEVLNEATTTNLAVIGNWAIRPASTTGTSGSLTVDWDLGSSQQFFVTGTTDFVINATSSHPKDGGRYTLRICNTGANTVTFSTPGNLRWFKGTTTIPTTDRQCAWIGMIFEATHGNSSNIYSVIASSTPMSY